MPKQIQKASGEIQEFSSDKLGAFLKRIEVPEEFIADIVGHVEAEIADFTPVKELRHKVIEHLRTLPRGQVLAARYNLKSAVRKLGPAGHMFEEFIARLLGADNFTDVITSTMVRGECVAHEIDVVATKDNQHHMIECKFHNQDGTKSDVTVALYTYARFLDVQHTNSINNGFSHVWLVTNTKLSGDALVYAQCKGMKTLTMELPYGEAIIDRVVKTGIFPISSLTTLSNHVPEMLTANYIIAQDVLKFEAAKISEEVNIPIEMIQQAQTEARTLIQQTAA